MIRRNKRGTRYLIAKTVSGRSVAWFRYSRTEVWQWVRQPERATRFRSHDDADHAAVSCTMCYAHQYRIETAPDRV